VKQKHFGSVLIMARSGWGKTWLVDYILKNWPDNSNETVVRLNGDNYTSWNKWVEATVSITNGKSVFAKLYNRTETYVIEDIHDSFFWSSSIRLKFLD
jgi:chromosomal replication initiation ATPase DnaA